MIEPGNIYCGDCIEVMKDIPDKSIDAVITDPPYGIGMDNSNKRVKPSRPNSYTHYPDFRYPEATWDKDRVKKIYFDEIFRISKHQMIFGANYYCEYMPPGYGWVFWDKLNGDGNCFSDGEFIFANKGVQSRRYSISQFDGLNGGKDRVHPTQKPIKLLIEIIIDFTDPNALILDPFLGSGTTAVAAIRTGRRFIGIEISQEYVNLANKRVQAEMNQLKLDLPYK